MSSFSVMLMTQRQVAAEREPIFSIGHRTYRRLTSDYVAEIYSLDLMFFVRHSCKSDVCEGRPFDIMLQLRLDLLLSVTVDACECVSAACNVHACNMHVLHICRRCSR